MAYDRISVDPNQMGGVACLRGLRIPVATVVAMIADGMTAEEILEALPISSPTISARLSTTLPSRSASVSFLFACPLEVSGR